MQRAAALTSPGSICLRCKILRGASSPTTANRSHYEISNRISHRPRAFSTSPWSSQALFPVPNVTEATPTVTAFTGKRSEKWEEGWFEGNIARGEFIGGGGGNDHGGRVAEGGNTNTEMGVNAYGVRRGPYRGVAVKRVREVRMSRVDGSGGGDGDGIGNGNGSGGSEVGAVTAGGGEGKVVRKTQEEGLEKESKESSQSSSSSLPNQAEDNSDLPETTIRQPLNRNHEPPDERTVNLGKTIRTLQHLLPTILSSPTSIPTSILSPSITLHLFPSSHPHLPTARGRVAYKTALWTSPFVWGQLPGRAKLEILAARVVKPCARGEELRVRWRAVPSYSSSSSTSSSPTHPNLFKSDSAKEGKEGFSGLFIFTFDDKGRILSHTIEHADRGWNRGEEESGYSFLGVAEWLLKKARQAGEGVAGVGGAKGEPGLVFLREGDGDGRTGRRE